MELLRRIGVTARVPRRALTEIFLFTEGLLVVHGKKVFLSTDFFHVFLLLEQPGAQQKSFFPCLCAVTRAR